MAGMKKYLRLFSAVCPWLNRIVRYKILARPESQVRACWKLDKVVDPMIHQLVVDLARQYRMGSRVLLTLLYDD
jgi:hypothetical protein